jgi:tRNA dimethylallyltransferase
MELEERANSEGGARLLEDLRKVDPAAAERMLPTNIRRIIRALEVFHTTGIPITIHHERQLRDKRYDTSFVGLAWERSALYDRINRRADSMIDAGFIGEVRMLLEMGFDERLKALQTVGYKEAFAYLRGDIPLDRMIELMKQNTRRFAKRQLTWFRPDDRIRWREVAEETDIRSIAEKVAADFRRA